MENASHGFPRALPKGRALKEELLGCRVALWLHYSVHGLSTWGIRDEMLSPPAPFPALLILLSSRINLFSIKSVNRTNICSKYPISLKEVILNIRSQTNHFPAPHSPQHCGAGGHAHIFMTSFPKAVSLAAAGKAKRQWAGTRPGQCGAERWGITHTDTIKCHLGTAPKPTVTGRTLAQPHQS